MHKSSISDWRWVQILIRVRKRASQDRLTTAASSVGFYAMLSMIPGLAAIIALYGEFANPQALKALSSDLRGLLPPSVVQILTQQIGRLAGQNGSSLNATPESMAWFVLMIWSANRGIAGFVDALNVIYDRVEERAFFQRLATTVVLTSAAVLFMALTIAGIVVLPVVIRALPAENSIGLIIQLARWPALLLLAAIAIALLLRFGPSRKEAWWSSIVFGSTIGASLWIGGSALFSWYASSLGSFPAIYGSLGSVIALLVWLWLSALAVLIGAECDAACTVVGYPGRRSGDEDSHRSDPD